MYLCWLTLLIHQLCPQCHCNVLSLIGLLGVNLYLGIYLCGMDGTSIRWYSKCVGDVCALREIIMVGRFGHEIRCLFWPVPSPCFEFMTNRVSVLVCSCYRCIHPMAC